MSLCPGKLRVSELYFEVPVDYTQPNGASIRLFARSVQRRASGAESEAKERQLPWLVYLQGGPGNGAPPPQDAAWIGPLLDRGYQVRFSCFNLGIAMLFVGIIHSSPLFFLSFSSFPFLSFWVSVYEILRYQTVLLNTDFYVLYSVRYLTTSIR